MENNSIDATDFDQTTNIDKTTLMDASVAGIDMARLLSLAGSAYVNIPSPSISEKVVGSRDIAPFICDSLF